VQRYRKRVSGASLDRIDMQIEMPPVPGQHPGGNGQSPSLENPQALSRVESTRGRQLQRGGCPNQYLGVREIECHCRLRSTDCRLLATPIEHLHLSVRAPHRVLRVARTIADLADEEHIGTSHLSEAIQYRNVHRHTNNSGV
jgi:magnesium chelatase family protein